jgi:hypothetical protein
VDLAEAQNWISTHAVIEQGYYLDGDDGQPNPSVVYCRKHAAAMAKRFTRERRKTILQVEYHFCEAWGGSDTVEHCGIKSCDLTLDSGGLTEEGIRWALGMDEGNFISFVASINELELARRAMTGGSTRSQYWWQLWLSQVLRNQKGVTKKQCLAFEAAWLAEQWHFALDILRQRGVGAARKRGRAA